MTRTTMENTPQALPSPYQLHLRTRTRLGGRVRFGRCEQCGFFDTVQYVLVPSRSRDVVRTLCLDCSEPDRAGGKPR